MNRNRTALGKSRLRSRVVSILTAAAVVTGTLPMTYIAELCGVIGNRLSAFAAGTGEERTFNTITAFENYVSNYDVSNKNDKLIFSITQLSSNTTIDISAPMGQTLAEAFDGEIVITDPIKFNITKPLFKYVTDDVEITVNSNAGTAMEFTRPGAGSNDPLFAEHVINKRSSGDPVKWNFQYDKNSQSNYVYDFAGFIGEMDAGAKVEIESIVFNNKGLDQNGNVKTANITQNINGDAGLICGTMDAGAELTVDSVTCTGDYANASFSITATSKAAGGLVGSMAEGSKLTLGSGLSCAQAANAEIKANNGTNGYAGGLVGKCTGGIIVNNGLSYAVVQNISGAAGSGGIAGYYETNVNNKAVDTNIVDLKPDGSGNAKYSVNGGGACGGLFGEVYNNGQDMTITVNEKIAPDHSSGNNATYGGLIGKYSSSAQTLSLNVSSSDSKEVTPKKTGGNALSYGGVIGEVALNTTGSTGSYVKINGVNVDSSNAATANGSGYFGGVIGKADDAFIELVNTNTISYSGISKDYAFAGVVGSLANGVLCLSGITDLSGAAGITNVKEPSGQIVGYRNCGFVYAESGWKLYRSTTGQKVDDIGSWGEVIRFGGNITQSDVITVDTTNHTVKLLKRSYSGSNYYKNLSSTTEFVKIALNAQFNSGTNGKVLIFEDGSNFTSAKILGTDKNSYDISFLNSPAPTIDLRGTGITGLTRDNNCDSNDSTSYLEYKKNINGNGATIILAIGEPYGYVKDSEEESGEREVTANDTGCGKIYRHKYNGLLAKATSSGGVINSSSTGSSNPLYISNQSKIDVEACTNDVCVGSLIACASGAVSVNRVEVKSVINHAGSSNNFYVGGLIGKAEGNVTMGNNYFCTFNGSIIGSSSGSSAVVGGLIGCITGNSFTSTINNATVSGTIQSLCTTETDQKIGGLIGVIKNGNNASTLNLTNITVSGLNVESNATDSGGGLLGYGWYKTDVNFGSSSAAGVTIASSTMKTTATNTAGLVYEGTGHWVVNNGSGTSNKEGIKITSATIHAASAESFGGIINNGCANNSAIYLELKYNGYKINSLTASALNANVPVFDEIAAYSKFDGKHITDNGQAIISIDTNGNALLQMGSSGTGETYKNQSGFTPKLNGATDYCNPNTRYYYNLGSYINSSDAAQKFLIWSVSKYAHSSIRSNFMGGYSGAADTDINLIGYSYYPINVDASESYTISGNISLWNNEFDTTEGATTWKRKSHGTTRESQHYLMQNGLFLNVNGSLTVNIKLSGDVSKVSDDLCGALVMGTVSGGSSTNPATVNVNGLVLDGIKINGTHNASTYAPLLINKSGSNATFDIKDVSAGTTTSGGVTSSVYSDNNKIASSLIGDLGSASASFVNISFSGIKLDGRNASGDIDSLDSVYYTKQSLFSRSTLLNSLKYSDNSSYGTYYFTYEEDYDTENSNDKLGNVTYGKEIRDTVENKDESNVSKQLKYDGSNYFVHPSTPAYTVSGGYSGFSTNYQNYVYDGYVATGNTENKHELKVNIASATFEGCGTYNDPYIIANGEDFDKIAKIINGTLTGSTSIDVPKSLIDSPAAAHSWCTKDESNNKEHYTLTAPTSGSNRDTKIWTTSDPAKSISDSNLAKYLAGAYYQLDTNVPITLSSNFEGISYGVTSTDYAFHGIIDGNDTRINNPSGRPLIASSNGCVVRNLNIYATSPVTLTSSGGPFGTTSASAPAYGVLIGKVLGGDNIIESVVTGFSGTNKITVSSDTKDAKIVPVGGYIGVVVNGGVIFKNMGSGSSGLSDTNFTAPAAPINDNNYLYINPIIGRVLNGYAVTVAGTNSSNDYKARNANVTMDNGTKNYSIADIDPDLDKLATVSATNTIQLPNAQSMFILSLLTQSGITADTNYGDYGLHFHKAAYNEIGSSALTTGDYANVAAARPYIVENFLDSTAQSSLANLTGSSTQWDIKLGGTETAWQLPDGFRGIGSLGFGQTGASGDTYVDARTIYLKNFSSIGNYGVATYAPEDTEHTSPTNIIELQLNINVKHYSSSVDNYVPVATGNGGLGLFDKFRQLNSSSDDEISYVKLSGKIDYDVPDITTYNKNNIDNNYLHVGGLAGCIGTGNETDNIIVNNIDIDGLEVNGFESAGGFFGYLKMANSANGQVNISNVTADEFSVSAKQYAGGIIGYFGRGNLTVSHVTITSPVILSYYHGYTEGTGNNIRIDFDNGVGGVIGFANNDSSNKPISFSNITLGKLDEYYSEGETNKSYIGYEKNQVFTTTDPTNGKGKSDDTVAAGGLVGRSHTKGKTGSTYTMEIDTCKIYNINLYGHRVAGLLGSDRDNDSVIHINNCNVISDLDTPTVIYGVTKDGKDRGCGGLVGGYNNSNTNGGYGLTVENSTVEGYIINGRNDTGGVCAWLNAGKLTVHNFTIKDVIIASDYSGCITGYQNDAIEGYNILADNVQFQSSTGLSTLNDNVGYIVGKNLNGKTTKIVGFTRQNVTASADTVVPDRMTGKNSKSTKGSGSTSGNQSYSYGGGYVIFADYQGSQTATNFSTINNNNCTNISGNPKAPYVYSSPSQTISSGNGTTDPQKLTGDGVSGFTYNDSSAGKIYNDKTAGTDKKRYQNNTYYDSGSEAILREFLVNKTSSFMTELQKTGITGYSDQNFPVLVLDDKDNVDKIVKDYIRLLTNTAYNFDKTTSGESSVYGIDIHPMKYNGTTKNFDMVNDSTKFALTLTGGKYTITENYYDNTQSAGVNEYRFTLIDVQFKDPTTTSQIAYHLYIPVMVEKCLYYSVELRPASGTTYKLDEYPDSAANVIENLGNPVTMLLTYKYTKSFNDWAKDINNGENIRRNYDKEILVKSTNLLNTARVVIVDPNNGRDTMRSGVFTSGNLLETTSDSGVYKLKVASSTLSGVCNLNDLMKVSIDTAATNKKLVSCAENVATVKINDPNNSSGVTYLKPATSSELANSSITKYAVKVASWDSKELVEENYYISIFTQEDEDNTNIYHYEVDSPDSLNDPAHPSSKQNGEITHVLIGNLYNNEVTNVSESNPDTTISTSNNTLGATITAEVGFSASALNNGVINKIEGNNEIQIYQEFLVSLKKMTDGLTSMGIEITPECSFTYAIDGVPIDINDLLPCRKTGIYVELPTESSIKKALIDSVNAYKTSNPSAAFSDIAENSKITLTATVTMSYSRYGVDGLAEQFPEKSSTITNGTSIVGYSKIASAKNGIALSHASDDEAGSRVYNMESASPVVLKYIAAENPGFANDGNADFGQLGINAQPDAAEISGGKSMIKTLISYDASELSGKESAEYLEVSFTLKNKVTSGNSTGYGSALSIDDYLDDFKINGFQYPPESEEEEPGGEEPEGEEEEGGSAAPAITVSDSSNIRTFKIPLSLLRDDDERCDFVIPVEFNVLSGSGSSFETNGGKYSNYRVTVEVSLLDEENQLLPKSTAEDWIIYTNARIKRDVIASS